MLSPELIKKADQIFLRSRHKVTDVFAGEFESAFRGRGIEFEEFREYVPGDDIRQIAWKVTARLDRPFVKVFREEREQTIFLLVDLSKSQDFGQVRSKREVTTEIAALLAYATIKSNDKIGLILFTDRIEKFLPPKKGRAHVWRVVADILSHEPQGQGTDIAQALRFFMTVCPRRSTCFLMSDLWDTGFENDLTLAAVKHDLILLRVLDQLEKGVLPKGVLMDFADNESGRSLTMDMANASALAVLRERFTARESQFRTLLRSKGIDELALTAGEDYVEALLKFFVTREKRR